MGATEINRWLLHEGRVFATVPELLEAFAAKLCEVGAMDRMWCGTKVLHPQAAAYLWVWRPGAPLFEGEISYDRFASMDSVDSPIQRLRLGAPFVRFNRARDPEPGLADISDLWEQGYSDYYGLTLRFRGEFVGAMTWSTRAESGFDADDIALFDAILPTFCAVFEPLARDLVSASLLCAYLGDDAGRRVAAGQVRRGDRQTQSAAVWFCDVRGFTQKSTELSRPELLDLLNDVFEVVVTGSRTHGGQVLKFLGDGVLIVFADAEGPDAERDACRRATAAADDVQDRLAALRASRAERGLSTAEVGIGLHHGEFTYGNVGSPNRLDFTVIGHSVNVAARVEALCRTLGEDVLASENFASHSAGWRRLGEHALKGVAAPMTIFGRDRTSASPLAE